MNTFTRVILHLHLMPQVGPAKIKKLVEALGYDTISRLYSLSQAEVCSFGFKPEFAAWLLEQCADTSLLEKELMLIDRHKISVLDFCDEEYPTLLKQIHCPPAILYVQGSTQFEERSIAFVGARKANQYGKLVVESCVAPLIAHGWTIVSGGALGADTFAHQASVDSGGKTVVVLGSGLLCRYPRSNNKLFDRIIEQGGSLVSSFPLQATPQPGNFPARNRIIAGMSKGCIVVQAAQKSGALITAQFALDEGREVFAIPGSIFDPLSAGCHTLLSQGALVVNGPEDILKACDDTYCQDQVAPQQVSFLAKEMSKVSADQQKLLQLLAVPKSVDDLVSAVSLPCDIIQDELSELQFSGLVEQDFTGFWKVL